jgi:hypothetical protein
MQALRTIDAALQGAGPEQPENRCDLRKSQENLAWSLADRRLANGGLSDCELELLDCMPVAGDARIHAFLGTLGVRNSVGLYVEPVVFLHNKRFELARNSRDPSDAVFAVVFLAPDDLGNPLDLAAWEPETGRLALLRGRVSMLGQDNLCGWRLGEPLIMHETLLEWLRAGREGVVVLDAQRASPLLRSVEPLGVKRASFGREMQAALTIRAPRILVATQRSAE